MHSIYYFHFNIKEIFRHWQADVLRHTFATYHLLYFRNPAELQLEMGHSNQSLLRSRYTNLPRASRSAAGEFWGKPGKVESVKFRGLVAFFYR